MPKKYVIEMICDWRSFSRKWGKKVKNTTLTITDKMVINPDTRKELELIISQRPNDKSSTNEKR